MGPPRSSIADARILVVDDDSLAVHSMHRVLTLYGVEVETALSSRSALERLQSSAAFDAAFVDYFLVGHEGHTLMKPLRRQGCCPVMISGSEQDGLERESIGQGAAMFLRKPFEKHEFLQAAVKAVEISRMWRASFARRPPPKAPRTLEPVGPSEVENRLRVFGGLSERERQVLARVVIGHTNEEIARAFRVSVSTIKYHDHNGRTRIGVASRRELSRLVLSDERDPFSGASSGPSASASPAVPGPHSRLETMPRLEAAARRDSVPSSGDGGEGSPTSD